MTTRFAELCATTNFSFLRGGSHPGEFVYEAANLGLAGLAVADRNTLAGVVRGHLAAKELKGFPYRIGCRLAFRDGNPDVVAWPTDGAAYGRLCRLLTEGNRRAPKGECHLDLADLLAWVECMVLGVFPGATAEIKAAATATVSTSIAKVAAETIAHSRDLPANVFTLRQTTPAHRTPVPNTPSPDGHPLHATLGALKDAFPGAVHLLATRPHGSGDARRLALLNRIARRFDVPLLATSDPLYHAPARRPLQDVLTCIREHVTLATAGKLLEANAERHLKSAAEMARLFADYPQALAESCSILDRLQFSLAQLSYIYPHEPIGDAANPQEALEKLTEEGARRRYPGGVPDEVTKALAYELEFIRQRDFALYFLTVYDIVRFAREREILCQGRGSAANSSVCFCLGITEVDPTSTQLLFERFMSAERDEPPDIDVDFEHERREEVMQYVYGKYSRERAGIAATLITYRTRSAVREVGKVFGLSEDAVGALASTTWGWSSEGVQEKDVRRAGLDPQERTVARVLALSKELIGFPRHLSQHVGGFVITRDRLDESVPVMNAAMAERTNIEWDKDDLDAVGMMKVDVLALGMLTCIRRAFDFLDKHYGRKLTLAAIHKDQEPAVYNMLCRADSLGTFQVESRAQMSMLPRLKPRKFYDLVIEVAIVRPGPIQGDMVHPYLLRREGKEKVVYPSPSPKYGPSDELEKVLSRTLGVPLFQEQAMKIAMVAAKFTGAEADGLRRAMATFRHAGTIGTFQKKLVDGMTARGYEREFAERCFHQIEGFGEYGFPESHAASFALLVYASAWLKCHYPDVFCAALLNAQPMGFYAPAQIVRDAREHGIEVRPVDINFSDWDCTLEQETNDPRLQSGGLTMGEDHKRHLHPNHSEMANDIFSSHAVRLGLRQIKGFAKKDADALMDKRGKGYDSVRDLWLRSGLSRGAIERLADADAFRSLGLDRRDALWAARELGGGKASERLPLFDVAALADIRREPDFALPPMPIGEHVVNDYRYVSLSLKAHPASFLRLDLAARGITVNHDIHTVPNGRRVTVAGLVLIRQRPGTAKGVIFMTIEDESGIANIIVWPKTFERFRPTVLGARLVAVTGKLQSASGVVHVVADKIDDLTSMLSVLSADAGDLKSLARADEAGKDSIDQRDALARHPRMVRFFQEKPDLARKLAEDSARVMPKGRNFH